MYVREELLASDRVVVVGVDGPEAVLYNIDDVVGRGTTEE